MRFKKMRTVYWGLALGALGAAALPAAAAPSDTEAALRGVNWQLSPGVQVPMGRSKPGFVLSNHFGYGFDAGAAVFSLGLSVPFFLLPSDFVDSRPALAGMLALQIHFPVGPASIYAAGAAGGGGGGGAAAPLARIGAGVQWHPSSSFSVGAEASYLRFGDLESAMLVFPIHFGP